ncbi:hypothetical protein AFLA_005025 [Aspergillus flavus NRRL3357]|nr:uncharacterized protein G4B84_007784 [Aspergillus flavus NRRL3357]KAF7616974.1 hypothetical protein AFLA_005025 [Aspergillus flavus NRRL3357]QMW32353.1 hypothetical protein G4B84_007784 [Aspergillus flavus NRRL3357]
MSLLTLPNELLFCIATLLLPSVQDVDSVAKASKILYAIANPILYHHQIFHQDSAALIWAAQHGKADPCNRLLQEGANPNTHDLQHRTPLSWAARNGHTEVSAILLCAGTIDPNAPDAHLQTPLAWAARHGQPSPFTAFDSLRPTTTTDAMHPKAGDYLAIVKLLLSAKGIPARIVKLLLAIPTIEPDQEPNFGSRALLTAVEAGYTDVVEALLTHEKVDPSLPSKHGITALASAAQLGRTHIVRLLLAKGSDPDRKDRKGMTPLMLAAEREHVEAVELLVSTGRVHTDFDLTKMNRSSIFAPSNLNEDVVRVFDDYKSRYRGGSSLDS